MSTPHRLRNVIVLAVVAFALPVAPAFAGRPSSGAARPVAVRTAGALSFDEALAWQVALDRAMFSPGLIDGRIGPKSLAAIRSFQLAKGLEPGGRFDETTRAALEVDRGTALRTYSITAADAAGVGPHPKSWPEKAACKRLGYKSLAALVAERGHCTIALLGRLNPGKNLDALAAGDTLVIPDVTQPRTPPRVAALEVNLADKTIRPLDAADRSVGLLHCSIAKHKEKRPSGRAAVRVVCPDPIYLFDPKMWPEVRGVNRKLVIPPGPRNPVGLFWIGLSLPGYGIHGTPEPEMIGKTGSHGCFRLTNWDAVRLGRLLRPGVPVEFLANTQPRREPPPESTTLARGPSRTAERVAATVAAGSAAPQKRFAGRLTLRATPPRGLRKSDAAPLTVADGAGPSPRTGATPPLRRVAGP